MWKGEWGKTLWRAFLQGVTHLHKLRKEVRRCSCRCDNFCWRWYIIALLSPKLWIGGEKKKAGVSLYIYPFICLRFWKVSISWCLGGFWIRQWMERLKGTSGIGRVAKVLHTLGSAVSTDKNLSGFYPLIGLFLIHSEIYCRGKPKDDLIFSQKAEI